MRDERSRLGKYRLLKQLAVGGMAEIYVASAEGLAGFEKQLAVKVIHPNYSQDPQFVQMLVDEAKLAVQLQHPNIVQTYDLGKVDGNYYIVMELIDGVDLHKVLKRTVDKDDYLPFEAAAFVASEVAAGLDYAHRRTSPDGKPLQIVHRDISPQNVLVSYSGEVKIVDFGIAKAARKNRKETAHGVIKGKYFYMSPEQAWGDPIDHRTDIFSTGILLYEMLAGEMLYFEEDMERLLDAVRRAQIAPPSKRRPGVPPGLEKIVMRALARKRENRYPTAGEMSQELAEWLRDNAPDWKPLRLGQYLRDLMGEAIANKARSPRESTQEIALESVIASIRDENSLIFRIQDLEPTHAGSAPKRKANEPTGVVRASHLGAAFESDFGGGGGEDRTVVDPHPARAFAGMGLTPTPTPTPAPTDGDDEPTSRMSAVKAASALGPPPRRGGDFDEEDTREEHGQKLLARLTAPSDPIDRIDQAQLPGVRAPAPRRPDPAPAPAPEPPSTARPTVQAIVRRDAPAPSPPPPRPATQEIQTIEWGGPGAPKPPAPAAPAPAPVYDAPPTVVPARTGWPWTQPDPQSSPLASGPQAALPSASYPIGAVRSARRRGVAIGLFVALLVVGAAAAVFWAVWNTAPSRGTIEVVTLPAGASVRIDGQPVDGKSPLAIVDVDPKLPHHVAVSVAGYKPWDRDVTFDGESLQMSLHVVLSPITGALQVDSQPQGADVVVNGRFRGQTPLEVSDLSPSQDVSLELRLRGYHVERRTLPWNGSQRLEVSIPLTRGAP